MLTALVVLTRKDMTPEFLEGVTARDMLRGLGGVIHLTVGRYAVAGGLPMNEAAPILFNDLHRELAGEPGNEEAIAVLRLAFDFMGAVWREDPLAAAKTAENVAGCLHALITLGQVLLEAETEVTGLAMADLASSYREQIMSLMAAS